MRLIRELAPVSCLELGTGLGISGAYQAASLEINGRGQLITLDGDPRAVDVASEGFASLGLGKAEARLGSIDETLAVALIDRGPVDYAYLDADHTEEATVDHFDAVLSHLADEAVVVLDDLPWTEGMRRAWTKIRRRHPSLAAIGLGRIGVVVRSRPEPVDHGAGR